MTALELAEQICETIHNLPEEQLSEVLRFVQALEGVGELDAIDENVAPLYRIHTVAVKTGISDLAHQHDHYLYGIEKRDA